MLWLILVKLNQLGHNFDARTSAPSVWCSDWPDQLYQERMTTSSLFHHKCHVLLVGLMTVMGAGRDEYHEMPSLSFTDSIHSAEISEIDARLIALQQFMKRSLETTKNYSNR